MKPNNQTFKMGCWSADIPNGSIIVDSNIANFLKLPNRKFSYDSLLNRVDGTQKENLEEFLDSFVTRGIQNCSLNVELDNKNYLIQICLDDNSTDIDEVCGFVKVKFNANTKHYTNNSSELDLADVINEIVLQEEPLRINNVVIPTTLFMRLDLNNVVEWSTDSINPLCGNQKFTIGVKCYESAFNSTSPCKSCPFEVIKRTHKPYSVIVNTNDRMVEITAEPTFTTDRQLSGAIVKINDITQIKQNERKIRELTQMMDIILAYSPVCIFIKNPNDEFRYMYWNKAMADTIGVPSSVAVGKTDFDVFPKKEDAEHFRHDDIQLLELNNSMEFEESFYDTNGDVRAVFTVKTLVPTEDKYPLIMGVSIDISSKKRYELELIKAKEKAEESDRFKSSFMANMSHEIRTPLNAIVGFSELLMEDNIENDDKKEYLAIIKKNNQLLLQLITDILDLSRIESRMMEFKNDIIDMNIMCQRIALSSDIKGNASVPISMKADMPHYVIFSDENRVQQVITNFLTNAIKFTTVGSIEIGMRLLNDTQLEIYVQDTGIGIQQDKVDAIFDRFVKLNPNIQGTGLGLSICRNLVEQMGGTIGVDSQYGIGSKFWLALPYDKNLNTGTLAVPEQ